MAGLRERWRSFWFEPVTASNLGFCRILFYAGVFLFYLPYDFAGWGQVSQVFWSPTWLFAQLHLPPLPASWLGPLKTIWEFSLALSCIGLFTSISTATAFVCGLYLVALPNNFGSAQHNDTLIIFVLGYMAVSRCGDASSLDSLIRTARRDVGSSPNPPRPSGEYTWPIRLVWVSMALVFFAAGVSKMRHSGLEWITSDNMAILMMQHNYHIANVDPLTSWGLNLAQHPWLCRLLATLTMLMETGYPLALFSPLAMWFFVPGIFAMQVGIRTFMGPSFGQYLLCNLFWVPWPAVGLWLSTRIKTKHKHAVIFDGACGFCQRTVAVMRRIDILRKVEFHDAAKQWQTIQAKFPHLSQEACLENFHLVTNRKETLIGFYSYRRLAQVFPFLWLVLPLLYLPGVPWIGCKVYAAVASRRYRGGCPLPSRTGLAVNAAAEFVSKKHE